MIPKFRMWSKSHEAMGEVYSLNWQAGTVGLEIDDTGWIEHLANVILMQSTGLFDKNGVEIFEGDVVRWGMLPNSFEIHHRYAVVERNPDIQFRILYYIDSRTGEKREGDNYVFHFGSFAYRNTEDCLEIIGNIHEHPELLENSDGH